MTGDHNQNTSHPRLPAVGRAMMRPTRHGYSTSILAGMRTVPCGSAAVRRVSYTPRSLRPQRKASFAVVTAVAAAGDEVSVPDAPAARQGADFAEDVSSCVRDNRSAQRRDGGGLGSNTPSTISPDGGGGGPGGPWTGRRFLGGDGGWEVLASRFNLIRVLPLYASMR